VDETGWLRCNDTRRMARHLPEDGRKWRLLACAYARVVWDLLPAGSVWRRVVEAAEAFADDRLRAAALRRLWRASRDKVPSNDWVRFAAIWCGHTDDGKVAAESAGDNLREAQRSGLVAEAAGGAAARASLLREVFGNPFRPLPARRFPVEVRGLAEACYAGFPEQSPDLAVLADALADLGEEAAAAHLRQGVHVKGCHIVDWVLGRGVADQDETG
jgi:hypothetical protein